MLLYTFSIEQPEQQFIQIKYSFDVQEDTTEVQLPSWRPGRYELSNFAKNIRNFKVFGSEGGVINFVKTTKDKWEINTKGEKTITVEYQYYATDLNAGSTYLDREQLYVNPVNCCLYVVGREQEACEIQLNIPDSYRIACSLEQNGKKLKAINFDELADSPWICSSNIQHETYEEAGVVFHIWFQGVIKVDWNRLLKDFKAFTSKQIEKFTEFPVPEYHFYFQIVPYRAYHGVEHQRSTAILLGPSYDVFEDYYTELLGVSSHELYHTWNVKAIRPIEMYPYDFTKENYSNLGYLCEGVTTYKGDLFLFKSEVFTEEQYFKELNKQLQRHFDNFARFNYSVAESSWDTWLDGYVSGVPSRKVSIYTEGCLLALITDVFVMRNSKEKYNLDDVMKRLYFNFYLNDKGVSEEDYKNVIEQLAGASFQEIFDNYIHGSKPFESILVESLEYLGIDLHHVPTKKYSAAKLGFKNLVLKGESKVKAIYPGSPAELSGMMLDDEVIAVNGMAVNNDLDRWLQYFAIPPLADASHLV